MTLKKDREERQSPPCPPSLSLSPISTSLLYTLSLGADY